MVIYILVSQVSQKDEYPYLLGFVAGIIEVDNVIIGLYGKELKMDERCFYQQPFWSHVEIGL